MRNPHIETIFLCRCYRQSHQHFIKSAGYSFLFQTAPGLDILDNQDDYPISGNSSSLNRLSEVRYLSIFRYTVAVLMPRITAAFFRFPPVS
jgi:hypothetical protein